MSESALGVTVQKLLGSVLPGIGSVSKAARNSSAISKCIWPLASVTLNSLGRPKRLTAASSTLTTVAMFISARGGERWEAHWRMRRGRAGFAAVARLPLRDGGGLWAGG